MKKRSSWLRRSRSLLLSLGCSLAVPMAVVPPVWSAEEILVYFGPLEFSVAVESLENFAATGEIEPDLALYANRLTPEQLQQLRTVLSTPADVTPVAVAQFLYSPQGEQILEQVGELIQTRAQQPGFYAIRSALILAAASEEGLTPLNVLRQFPTSGIRINSERAFDLLDRVGRIIGDTQRAIAAIEAQAQVEITTANTLDFPWDLRQPGSVTFRREVLQLNDLSRNRAFPVDLYLPQVSGRLPLAIVSHGLGSERASYSYLAAHLASYGFVVAVPEHPGSNSAQIQALANGLASNITPSRELIDRPLDIKYLLDVLEQDYGDRLNWQQVGIVGQSFGGYTALALAGAKINFERIATQCQEENPLFNISFLIQCQARNLPAQDYDLADDRIQAAIAINPLTSTIFGASELAKIQIPLVIVTGSADTVTPALAEQIRPFTQLTTPDKYLVLLENGTHFSVIGSSENDIPLPAPVLGPDPAIAQMYTKALSLAFFQTYIANRTQYQSYLSESYAQMISQPALPLSLVQSLTLEEP
ncbi:MAG: alpha/beta hydrolase [Jaaginema sp. PMC 1079.18]|nr:alpha/beta hydrolase [Jaaginema sp. PMC 1080.18]MEC4851154.1 alpha/beta hydrolase [Jaaginema sp. PMC 1079.18]MEC4866703.1 alpha/beta hydrolase [Jaaginema sp. PMC 1078.18]